MSEWTTIIVISWSCSEQTLIKIMKVSLRRVFCFRKLSINFIDKVTPVIEFVRLCTSKLPKCLWICAHVNICICWWLVDISSHYETYVSAYSTGTRSIKPLWLYIYCHHCWSTRLTVCVSRQIFAPSCVNTDLGTVLYIDVYLAW